MPETAPAAPAAPLSAAAVPQSFYLSSQSVELAEGAEAVVMARPQGLVLAVHLHQGTKPEIGRTVRSLPAEGGSQQNYFLEPGPAVQY